jgi:serralysin
MDLITDFNFAGQLDRIDLSGVDANAYAAGDQAFTFIGTSAFSGNPGEINYYHSGGETIIQMQTGTGVDIEGGIRLSGIHTPDASWFVL